MGICILFPNILSVNTKIAFQISIIQLSSKYKQPTDNNLSIFYNHKTNTLHFVSIVWTIIHQLFHLPWYQEDAWQHFTQLQAVKLTNEWNKRVLEISNLITATHWLLDYYVKYPQRLYHYFFTSYMMKQFTRDLFFFSFTRLTTAESSYCFDSVRERGWHGYII